MIAGYTEKLTGVKADGFWSFTHEVIRKLKFVQKTENINMRP